MHRPKPSRTLPVWIAGSFTLALSILLVLFFADVRLGQGYFAILYSPVADWRLMRLLPLLVVGGVACGAVWALAHAADRTHRATGHVLLMLAFVAAGVWVWWGPPDPMNQQAFNMTSLSTDGAFAFESGDVAPSIRDYLRHFADQRLARTVEQMGGTRVLSNPPLMTVLSYAMRRTLSHPPDKPGWLERMLIDEQGVAPVQAVELAHALRFSVALTAMWVLSGAAAYLLGRLFLPAAGAAVFAIVVTFNPCTVHYVPGKDAAQLLTINLMLWAWLAAWKRRSPPLAALGGAILTIGTTSGLVHIWVALIAVLATLWQGWAERDRRAMLSVLWNALAAAAGGAFVCAIAYATLDWNIPRTLLAVSRRWTSLQSTFAMDRAVWYLIGLPIFLLFLSPGFWTLLGLTLRRPRLNFGTRLAICTAVIMLIIYGPLGVTYELPRLWIAFLPPLTLGLGMSVPLLKIRTIHPRVAQALALIVAMHIAFTALHWTLFDARESEERLTNQRFYD
jgi:hypothetical protein